MTLNLIADYSEKCLKTIPEKLLDMGQLKMLYLRNNCISELPEDFFDSLVNLLWLDLRHNQLETIPLGIGRHTHLETLLIQDNKITHLPNELGIVPTLRVVQMSGNPIVYPPRDVINKGADETINFLRQQYYNPTMPSTPIKENDNEKILCVVEQRMNSSEISLPSSEVQEELMKKTWSKTNASAILPALSIKSVSRVQEDKGLSNKSHSLIRRPSRIRIKSRSILNSNRYIKTDKIRNEFDDQKGIQQEIKDSWLGRLKELLEDQEKLLQQEKNVSELSRWRSEKKMELPRTESENQVTVPPYGTYSMFDRMLSRNDLQQQVHTMINKYEETSKVIDIQRMVNDVVSQLRNLEIVYTDDVSPRSKQQIANREIQSLKNLHSKICSLQLQNSRQ